MTSGYHIGGKQPASGVPVGQLGPEERVRGDLLHGQGRVRHQQWRMSACLQEHHWGLLLLMSSGQ